MHILTIDIAKSELENASTAQKIMAAILFFAAVAKRENLKKIFLSYDGS
jgi:hypothetical protein